MANIREFTSTVNTIRPSETGIDAVAQGARRIGALGSATASQIEETGRAIGGGIKAVGDAAVDYITHKEIASGAPKYANLQDTLTQQWNDIASKADPNDPAVAQRFREQVLEPSLEKYRENFGTEGGQRWAEAHIDSLRNHMFMKTAADMSSLSARAVSVNIDQTANRMSNTAMTDPTSVPHLLETADGMVSGIVDSAPNLKGADAAKARMGLTQKMKEAIVKAGAQGAITRASDPEAEAKRWGEQYPDYINGQDLKALSANARSEIRARNYDFETNRRRAREIAQDKSAEATGKYLIDVRGQDPRLANDPTAQKILHDPELLKSDKNNLLNYIDRQLKPETDARVSATTTVDLLRQLHAPGADLDDIMEKAWQARLTDPGKPNSLTDADFNRVRQEIIGRKTPEGQDIGKATDEFMKSVTPQIDKSNPLMNKIDQDGHANVYRLKWDLKRKIDEYRKAGKDWHDLLDPSKPDYMGSPAALQPYQKPLQQSIQDAARRLGGSASPATPNPAAGASPSVVPRKPNETPEQYLSRIGKR